MNNTRPRNVRSLTFRDGVGEIRQEGDIQLAQTALLPGSVHPGQVSEVRVDRAGHHLGTDLPELCDPVVEGQDLGGTDEGEVQRVEEEDQILAQVVLQLDLGELSVDDGRPGEVWRRLGDHGLGDLDIVASSPGLGRRGSARSIVTSLGREADCQQARYEEAGGEHVCSGLASD